MNSASIPSEQKFNCDDAARLSAMLKYLDITDNHEIHLGGYHHQSLYDEEASKKLREQGISSQKKELTFILYHAVYARDLYVCLNTNELNQILDLTAANEEVCGLRDRLTAAHSSKTRWDTNWQIYRVDTNGTVHARKGDRHRICLPGSYIVTGSTQRFPRIDDSIQILQPAHAHDLQPGCLYLFGDFPDSHYDENAISRIYLNIKQQHLANLVHEISSRLNHYRVPYRLKCQMLERHQDRADGTVLYVARRNIQIVLRVLSHIAKQHRYGFCSTAPLFTKRLSRGIAAAEDAGTGESFGLHRMAVVAEALLAAPPERKGSVNLAEIEQHFVHHQIAPSAPFIHAGNVDLFHWPEEKTNAEIPS